jgi:uncharacterized protein YigE (DUF2233 family)
MLRRILGLALLAFMPGLVPAAAQTGGFCRDIEFESRPYTLCEVSPGADLRLFRTDAEGENLGSFEAVNRFLADQGKGLVFAMNAGMYHPDYRPVGLYIENGTTARGLVTSAGGGNFGLVPNGVFCVAEGGFSVIETGAYARSTPNCRFASQSGPMLVIDGALHPRFLADSPSVHIRNGVGVTRDGRAIFAISGQAVNFHTFARLFRDALDTPNALYFDGSISRLYAPELRRNDFGFAMGPIIGLVAPLQD